MTNLLNANFLTNPATWIFFGLLAFLVVMAASTIRRRKTAQSEYMGMLDTLRPGMRVKTVGGVIGTIREIREEAVGFKTVLLETPSLILYDLQAIYGVVNEDALANQPANVQQHPEPDNRVESAENVSKTKETKRKSK